MSDRFQSVLCKPRVRVVLGSLPRESCLVQFSERHSCVWVPLVTKARSWWAIVQEIGAAKAETKVKKIERRSGARCSPKVAFESVGRHGLLRNMSMPGSAYDGDERADQRSAGDGECSQQSEGVSSSVGAFSEEGQAESLRPAKSRQLLQKAQKPP